jgi:hypothetical protein
LRGPLGHGFQLPGGLRHLALAALDRRTDRLLSLAEAAFALGADVALAADIALPRLPASLELLPLSALPEILPWADLLALDLPLEKLPQLRDSLGLGLDTGLPCPAQALVVTPMPCMALAECGVCAVPARRGWKLACQDGPVFDLRDLNW